MNAQPKEGLVYLAVPYSHPDPTVREARFQAANRAAAALMQQGLHIFSPISHTHPIALAGKLPVGWDYWETYDRAVLSACSKLIVLTLDGWSESKGVQEEIKIATEFQLPIEYHSYKLRYADYAGGALGWERSLPSKEIAEKWRQLEFIQPVSVVQCARCGGDHYNLEFAKMKIPCGEFTHWAECPESGDPILMKITFDE